MYKIGEKSEIKNK
jgi:hypothetical protein